MNRRSLQNGFSLLEFMTSMFVLVFIFAATMTLFVPLLKRSKVEGGISQSQIEGIIGLELLRTDIVHAGHGLPWTIPGAVDPDPAVTYTEAVAAPGDALNDSPSNPPRALGSVNNASANTPDYFVIKANNVDSVDPAAQKVSYIQRGDTVIHSWGDPALDFVNNDYLTVVRLVDPSTGIPLQLQRRPGTGSFWLRASEVTAPPASGFANEIWYLFGMHSTQQPVMPFNRADYSISTASVPDRCADELGVLTKAVVSQADGASLTDTYPLLDCVADFQIAYGVDIETIPDGKVDCFTNHLSNLPAMNYTDPTLRATRTRDRVREVHVYVLAQEGVFDHDYEFTGYDGGTNKIRVGETNTKDCLGTETILGQDFDLSTLGPSATYHKDYRWKVYRFVVHPENLTYSLIGAAQGAK
jgi:hypothetical protein